MKGVQNKQLKTRLGKYGYMVSCIIRGNYDSHNLLSNGKNCICGLM